MGKDQQRRQSRPVKAKELKGKQKGSGRSGRDNRQGSGKKATKNANKVGQESRRAARDASERPKKKRGRISNYDPWQDEAPKAKRYDDDHYKEKKRLTREQRRALRNVSVPCAIVVESLVTVIVTQLIALIFRVLTLLFNIAMVISALAKLSPDPFEQYKAELISVLSQRTDSYVDIGGVLGVFADIFSFFHIRSTATKYDICVEVLMPALIFLLLFLLPVLYFVFQRDMMIKVAVLMGDQGLRFGNFIVRGIWHSAIVLTTDLLAKLIKLSVYLYGEILAGFWSVFYDVAMGLDTAQVNSTASAGDVAVDAAGRVQFESCVPDDPAVAISFTVIGTLFFVFVLTPLLLCVCLPGLFSSAKSFEPFDGRAFRGAEAPLPRNSKQFLFWSFETAGFLYRLYFFCHPPQFFKSWTLMVYKFLANVKAIVLLTFGIWNTAQSNRFEVNRRARKVDWNILDPDNQQQTIIAFFGKQYGLFWVLFPGGVIVQLVAEHANNPPMFVNAEDLELKHEFKLRRLTFATQMLALIGVFIPCWSPTEVGMGLAVFSVLPNWVLESVFNYNDKHVEMKANAQRAYLDEELGESYEETSS